MTDEQTLKLSRLARQLLDDLADYYSPVSLTDKPCNEQQAMQLILDAIETAQHILDSETVDFNPELGSFLRAEG